MKPLYYFIIVSFVLVGCDFNKKTINEREKKDSIKVTVKIEQEGVPLLQKKFKNQSTLELRNTRPILYPNTIDSSAIDTSFYHFFRKAIGSKDSVFYDAMNSDRYLHLIKIEFENKKLVIVSYWHGYLYDAEYSQKIAIFSKNLKHCLGEIEVGRGIPDQFIYNNFMSEGKFLPQLTYSEIDSDALQLNLTSYSYDCQWNEEEIIKNYRGRIVIKEFEIVKVDSLSTSYIIENFRNIRVKEE